MAIFHSLSIQMNLPEILLEFINNVSLAFLRESKLAAH